MPYAEILLVVVLHSRSDAYALRRLYTLPSPLKTLFRHLYQGLKNQRGFVRITINTINIAIDLDIMQLALLIDLYFVYYKRSSVVCIPSPSI
jgi:hypothetical protein